MSTFTVIVTPGWSFPAGVPVDLAALRAGARPTITLEGTFSSTTIADGAITEPKHATGGVSTRALADGSVTEPKLGDEAVSSRTIAPRAVTQDKIATPLTGAAVVTFTGPSSGVVPAASAADRNNFLRGDGRWADPSYNAVTAVISAQNYI